MWGIIAFNASAVRPTPHRKGPRNATPGRWWVAVIRPGPRRGYAGGAVQRTTFAASGGPSRLRFVVLVAIAIAVLAIGGVAWFFLGRGSGACTKDYCETTLAIEIPPDFEQHSKIYERNPDADPVADGFNLEVTMDLEVPTTDDRGLNFYGYNTEEQIWEPVASAALDELASRQPDSSPPPGNPCPLRR